MLIFHKAAAGELEEDSGLLTLAKLSEIDVSIEGVKGAKNFFEAKVWGGIEEHEKALHTCFNCHQDTDLACFSVEHFSLAKGMHISRPPLNSAIGFPFKLF